MEAGVQRRFGTARFHRHSRRVEESAGVAYAFCRLDADDDQPVVLKIRSNDGVRVWLNDKLIHDQHVGRTIEQAEDIVATQLQQGPNRLLVKVGQSGGDWGLQLRVVAPDGQPARTVPRCDFISRAAGRKDRSGDAFRAPVVLKTSEGPRQAMVLDVCSGGLRNVACRMQRAGESPRIFPLGDLPPGRHRVEFQKPVLAGDGPAEIWLESETDRMELPNVSVPEPRPWTVYLVQHVHTDIGYTRPQTEILPEHLRYIDYALDYCDLTDDYPDDARFRWTCEITWAVREYLKRRPPGADRTTETADCRRPHRSHRHVLEHGRDRHRIVTWPHPCSRFARSNRRSVRTFAPPCRTTSTVPPGACQNSSTASAWSIS